MVNSCGVKCSRVGQAEDDRARVIGQAASRRGGAEHHLSNLYSGSLAVDKMRI